jgi:hypothetical protein
LTVWIESTDLLLLVLFLWLSSFHTGFVIQKVVHFGVLLMPHVLTYVVCIVSHLVLHYWLVLELLQAEVLLIGSTHIGALVSKLLALIPSGAIRFNWNFGLILLCDKILLLLLPKLLLFWVVLTYFTRLRIVFKSIRKLELKFLTYTEGLL